jgi:hypothetical protein
MQVGLQPLAGVQHGLRVQVSLGRPPVRRPPDHLLPDHDHEHQQQLRLAGQEQQEHVRVRVEPEHLTGDHPAGLDDQRHVEGRHRGHPVGEPGGQPAVDPDVLVVDRGRRLDPLRGPGQHLLMLGAQLRAVRQVSVLRHQVVLDLLAVDQDRLGVLVGVHGPPVGTAPEHLLAEQDDEDQQQLGHVAEEQQERVRVRVEAEHRPRAQHHPGHRDDRADVDGPHRSDPGGDPGGEPLVEPCRLVGVARILAPPGMRPGMADLVVQAHDRPRCRPADRPVAAGACYERYPRAAALHLSCGARRPGTTGGSPG